jgi:squalene-hopene/tetraprenyl-beta-curcumene cyclase
MAALYRNIPPETSMRWPLTQPLSSECNKIHSFAECKSDMTDTGQIALLLIQGRSPDFCNSLPISQLIKYQRHGTSVAFVSGTQVKGISHLRHPIPSPRGFLNSMCLMKERVEPILKKSVKSLLEQQDDKGCWSFPAHLGSHYISLYALFLEWMRFRGFSSRLYLNRLAGILLETQLPDGSWRQARDPALSSGDINASVLNYAALKFFKTSISVANVQPAMDKAGKFILASGGIDTTNQFTKTFLALFGLRGWDEIGEIPYLVFLDALPLNYRQFSQWVIPHLMPMAYLRHNRVSHKIRGTFGPELELNELYTGAAWQENEKEVEPSVWYDGFMVSKILQQQRKHGSWGGYTVSTLFSIAVLDHFYRRHPGRFPAIPQAIKRSLSFVDQLYFDHGTGNYLGCLMDGGVWDTILAAQALARAGETCDPLTRAANNLYETQTAEGGFPYGRDFEEYPDVDDTSRALVFLQKMAPLTRRAGASDARKRGIRWLLKRQNSDGGWGAFDRDNVGSPMAKLLAKRLSDSVELFDDSTADNTGHVLTGLGAYGLTTRHSRSVRRAVRFLRGAQDAETGLWEGRWGINTLYGTTHAGTGLLRVGESPRSSYLLKAARTLMSFQNADGGFGESTLSYVDDEHRGRGASTPSQTAWVLEFLCEMDLRDTPVVSKAVNYLLDTRTESESWRDGSVVGTGHPGLLYMEYPVYPKTFPVMALANYLKPH